MIHEFVGAIEKAFANLADSTATAESALKLGMNVEQSTADATEEKDGSNQVETTIFAAAVDAEGKVLVAASDCVQVKFTFTAAGASTLDTAKAISSKRELGANYGMVAYGKAIAEWDVQAANYAAYVTGKTAEEVAGIAIGEDKKPVEGTDLRTTVTIKVADFQGLIAKAMQ